MLGLLKNLLVGSWMVLPAGMMLNAKLGGILFWLMSLLSVAIAGRELRKLEQAALQTRALVYSTFIAVILVFSVNVLGVAFAGLPLRHVNWWPVLMLPAILLASTCAEIKVSTIFHSVFFGLLMALVQEPILIWLNAAPESKYSTSWIIQGQLLWGWILVAVCLGWVVRPAWSWGQYFILGGAIFTGVFLVGSRGPVVVLPLLLVVVLTMHWRERRIWALVTLGLVAVSVLLWVIDWNRFGPSLHRFIALKSEVIDGVIPREGDSKSSLGYRWHLIKLAWEALNDAPLFGLGPKGFGAYVAGRGVMVDSNGDLMGLHPHNTVLSILVSYGLVGMLVIAGAIGLVLYRVRKISIRFFHGVAIFLAGWVGFSLTNDILAHQSTIRAFVVGFVIVLVVGLQTVETNSSD